MIVLPLLIAELGATLTFVDLTCTEVIFSIVLDYFTEHVQPTYGRMGGASAGAVSSSGR